jgi:dehydrogenase/reductase SDR family protein 12
MIRVHEVRETDRPIDEVFAYVADFRTTAGYDPGVARATRRDEGPVGVGATYDVLARFLGRSVPMVYRIERHEPPTLVVLVGEAATTSARDEIHFSPTPDGGTRVAWTLDLRLKGVNRLAEPILAPVLRRVGRAALDGLAARLARPGPLR